LGNVDADRKHEIPKWSSKKSFALEKLSAGRVKMLDRLGIAIVGNP